MRIHARLLLTATALSATAPFAAYVQAEDLLPDDIQFSGASLHLRRVMDVGTQDNDDRLISMTTRPGDSAVYLSSQNGKVWRGETNASGQYTTSLWFDFNDHVDLSRINNPQGGFRSVAFHPDFSNAAAAGYGKLYTTYVGEESPSETANYIGNTIRGVPHDSVVAEWTYDFQTNGVDASTQRSLFHVPLPIFDHAIRQGTFNPVARPGDEDYGLLYIGHGDASDQSATFGGGQNTDDVLGKVLRINPLASGDPANGGAAYTTPGNPWAEDDDPNTMAEVYAYGFRNPHNLAFNRDVNGVSHLMVTDIGRDNIDEINVVTAGENHGWSEREGTFVHRGYAETDPLEGYYDGVYALDDAENNGGVDEWTHGYTYPTIQIDHNLSVGSNLSGFAAAGGFVIQNGSDPALNNQFIFGLFGSNSNDGVDGGPLYHADFETMLAQKTSLEAGEMPSDLTWMYPEQLGILFDHDDDPSTDDREYDTLVQLLKQDGSNSERADLRFGRGPRGELYISSKQNGHVYLVTNTLGLTGDANFDGAVDLLDLDILGANWRADGVGWAGADFNLDGTVDLLDLDILGANWGEGSTSFAAALAATNIPEPGTSMLGTLLLIGSRIRTQRERPNPVRP